MSLLTLLGCANDVAYVPAARVLEAWSMVDAGVLAVGEREPFVVPLFSTGRGRLTVLAIDVEPTRAPSDATGEAFLVDDDDWVTAGCDGDGDGAPDCADLPAYDDASDADTIALPVLFAPTAIGDYEAVLTVWSNDTQTTESAELPDGSGRTEPIWRVQLRGRAAEPCARVWPSRVDFGPRSAGGEFSTEVNVENCGVVRLVVSAAATSSPDLAVSTSMPLYVLAGTTEPVRLTWYVPGEAAGEPTPLDGTVTFSGNGATLTGTSVQAIGNTCEGSSLGEWDSDADGWRVCGGDCDDDDPTIGPSAVERANNGEDEDCDGAMDEEPNGVSTDEDGDGATEIAGDCDDADPGVRPGSEETEDGVDNDCDGTIDEGTDARDDDGDSWAEREGDCDDATRLVAPDMAETIDGLDNDCDGRVDEGGLDADDDGDGLAEREGDCDDGDPWVRPDASEFCDGYDNDCDARRDEGELDEPDGACAFIPSRIEEEEDAETPEGCAHAPGAGVPLLAALAMVARRRPRGQAGRCAPR